MSTTTQLSENSHQGFEGLKAALCLGAMEAKSNTASGMPVCLRRNGIGSRSSSKERDAETGLDYFGARYYSGAQGRFTSPDPLLNSGRPWEPQSWNRYAFVLNNPLKFTDPTGLYEFAGCSGTDNQCNSWRELFDKGIADARKALASGKLSKEEKDKLEAVLDYLGTSGDGNDVRIAFGPIKGAATGISPGKNQIKLDMAKIESDFQRPAMAKFDLAVHVGATGVHEGTHSRDRVKGIYNFSVRTDSHLSEDLTLFKAAESRAYETESYVFKGLNVSSRDGLWNTSWDAADRETLRSIGVQQGAQRSLDAVKKEISHKE